MPRNDLGGTLITHGCAENPLGVEQVAVADLEAERIADHNRFGIPLTCLDEFLQAVVVPRGSLKKLAAGGERLGQDGHSPTADESVIPAVIVVEAERENLGLAGVIEAQECSALNFSLDAAAAECSGLRSVGVNEHCRAGLLRRAAAGLHHRAIDARQSPGERPR